LLCRLYGVEDDIDAGVACDVRHHLPTEPVADLECGGDLLRRQCQESAIPRVVHAVQVVCTQAVRLPHERRADQDAAISDNLERTDLQPLVAAPRSKRQASHEALDLSRLVWAWNADGDRRPHAQTIRASEILI